MSILDNLLRCDDLELLKVLPYIRDENGEKVSLVEMKHFLREQRRAKHNELQYVPGREIKGGLRGVQTDAGRE